MATTILGLPELESAQNQKYLTVNSALNRLDVLVNLTVFNRTVTAPPGSPSNGHRYIVASPATGAFTGQENNIAAFIGSNWIFFTPSEGWRAYDQGANQFIIWNGSAWVSAGLSSSALSDGSVTLLGVGATPDTTNRLSVESPGVLFDAETDDFRLTMNKVAAGDDVGFLLQTGFSTRALIGLLGNDDFSIKVTPDGSSFFDSIVIDKDTGNVAIGSSSDANNKLLVNGESVLFTNSGDLRFTFNKGATADDVALTFQSGFSARARVGLLASDDFTFKVSPDGSSYFDGLIIDKDNGQVNFPVMTRFQAFVNYRQYIGTATWTKVDINDETLDRANDYDTGTKQFTARYSGLHYLCGQVEFSTDTTDPTAIRVALYINGTMSDKGTHIHTSVIDGYGYSVEGIFNLAPGDDVELYVYFVGQDGYVQSGSTLSGFYIL